MRMYTQPPKLILIQEKKNYQMQMCSRRKESWSIQYALFCCLWLVSASSWPCRRECVDEWGRQNYCVRKHKCCDKYCELCVCVFVCDSSPQTHYSKTRRRLCRNLDPSQEWPALGWILSSLQQETMQRSMLLTSVSNVNIYRITCNH